MDRFRLLLSGLKPDAGPGLPFSLHWSENKDVIAALPELLFEAVIDRLGLLCQQMPDHVRTAADFVSYGYCDPYKLFIKNEPHVRTKIENGRFRIIFSVSIVDQCVAKVLFDDQNSLEKEVWRMIPTKCGLGFTQEHDRAIVDYVMENCEITPDSTDASGWDFSVQGWELELVANSRIAQSGLPPNHPWSVAVRNYYKVTSLKCLVQTDGQIWEQTEPGIMASGLLNTGQDNSKIGYLDRKILNIPFVMQAGDDSVATSIPNLTQRMLELGHRVTVERLEPGALFAFCSRQYFWNRSYTTNDVKLLFNLLNQGGSCEEREVYYQQWLMEMRNHPQLEFYRRLVEEIGWRLL
jgi:hypothetical protein